MREITLDIKIIRAGVHSSLVLVPSRYDPSLDRSIVASCADLRLARASTSRKYHGSNSIKMSPQPKPDLEAPGVRFLRWVQRQLMFTTSAP
jgi:hypothetical protein